MSGCFGCLLDKKGQHMMLDFCISQKCACTDLQQGTFLSGMQVNTMSFQTNSYKVLIVLCVTKI